MIKVLHVLSCMERGGTEAYVMNNLRNMDKKEFQNDFLVFIKKENPYAKEIEQIGGKIFYCCTPQIKNLKKFIKNVVDCIKENGPYDVVHSHINISNSFVVYAAKKAGVKNIISHAHGFFGGSYRIDKLIYQTFQKYLIKKYSVNKLACSKLVGYYL